MFYDYLERDPPKIKNHEVRCVLMILLSRSSYMSQRHLFTSLASYVTNA